MLQKLTYVAVALLAAVGAKSSNFTSASNSTISGNSTSSLLVPCDAQMSCNQVLSMISGTLITDSKCYFLMPTTESQTDSGNAKFQSKMTELKKSGFPMRMNEMSSVKNIQIVYSYCFKKQDLKNGLGQGFQYSSRMNSDMQEEGDLTYQGMKVFTFQHATQSQKIEMNGQIVSDARVAVTFDKDYMLIGIRQKVLDYFYYSYLQGSSGVNETSCGTLCGRGIFEQKCCAGVSAVEPKPQKTELQELFFYVCIDRSVAAGDMTMNIADMKVDIACVESGSKRIVGLTITALLALVSAI